MGEAFRTFEKLECWQACRAFRLWISEFVRGLPAEERYRLADQLTRASRSSASNIAEGYGRFHYKETIQFCRQSRGSLYECLDHLLVAQEDSLISDDLKHGREMIEHAVKLINGYIRYLKNRQTDS